MTKKPDVAASSHTIVSSGNKPANIGPIFSGPNSPEVGILISSSGVNWLSILVPSNKSLRALKAYFPSWKGEANSIN